MTSSRNLETYAEKRDLRHSKEPAATRSSPGSSSPIFVIQKHDARTTHYDFRLEADGVLVSWAVPKGPSTDPREKRLAILVEDHPRQYADFEGVIPKNNYGAGTVMIWDRGTYENMPQDGKIIPIRKCLENGHITIWLNGHKLRGGYALIRFRPDREQWLLIKMRDDQADARRNPVNTEQTSVVSGRTMHDIATHMHDNREVYPGRRHEFK